MYRAHAMNKIPFNFSTFRAESKNMFSTERSPNFPKKKTLRLENPQIY